ncbi:MAG: hypothetical protein H7146_14575 [Burkholderiaceae bacterium]|nr:hypothetical protein [Microbacteriaceae bacterium]
MRAARPLLGWYLHHHGRGHLTRFLALRPLIEADVVVFSSLPRPRDLPAATDWVLLDSDSTAQETTRGTRHPSTCSPDANGTLHWAPLGHRGHSARLGAISQALAGRAFSAVVVDVSVEVTVLVRLLGVAPILLAQPGVRTDDAHLLAFRMAERIIAPWPAGVPGLAGFPLGAAPVEYVGGISRFTGRHRPLASDPWSVLVLGGGGSHLANDLIRRAAAATPDHDWRALGTHQSGSDWCADPWAQLCAAEVVVSWAGQNGVADLAASDSRAIVIPQERPFLEQATTAAALGDAGLALVLPAWPEPGAWPALLDRAARLDPDWRLWQSDGAAGRAAAVIDGVLRAADVAVPRQTGAASA